MLQNAYSLAKIGADTAENEQHFAEILRAELVLVLEGTASCAQGDNGGVSELSTGDYYGEDAMLFGTSEALRIAAKMTQTSCPSSRNDDLLVMNFP